MDASYDTFRPYCAYRLFTDTFTTTIEGKRVARVHSFSSFENFFCNTNNLGWGVHRYKGFCYVIVGDIRDIILIGSVSLNVPYGTFRLIDPYGTYFVHV